MTWEVTRKLTFYQFRKVKFFFFLLADIPALGHKSLPAGKFFSRCGWGRGILVYMQI